MNSYLVVISKAAHNKISWWGYEIEAEDVDEVSGLVNDTPEMWGDCEAWEIISIHKQWDTVKGQMVMDAATGRLA